MWVALFMVHHWVQHFISSHPFYNIYLNLQVLSQCFQQQIQTFSYCATMHNGQFSQDVRGGSPLHTLRGIHPEHYLIPAQGYPNMPSSVTHLLDLKVAARFVCFCFCCLIYDNPPQVALWGWFLIYSYSFLMLIINVKLLETVSRGGPARTKACCPDSV